MDLKIYKRMIFLVFGLFILGYLIVVDREVPEEITHMFSVLLGYFFGGVKK